MFDATTWSALSAIAVALIAALATVTGQYLLNRREPFAIVRLKRLSEAIESMPTADSGRSSLVEARTILAKRLAKSLVGPQGFGRVLRVGAWMFLGAGLGIIAFGLIADAVSADPSGLSSESITNVGFWAVVASPYLLLYSALWPYIDSFTDAVIGRVPSLASVLVAARQRIARPRS